MDKKKKIAFVLTQSLDSPSGLGRYGPIARELVKHGYQVEIIALHYAWNKLTPQSYIDSGVLVKYVGQMHVRKEGNQKIYYSPLMFFWISLISTFRLTYALFRSDADLIHLGKPQPYNVIASIFSRRGRPIYCDCDDYEAETNLFSNKLQRKVVIFFENIIVRFADGLTVNTNFTRNRYIDLGFNPKNIIYVPNGVERSRFEKLNDHSNQIRHRWNIPVGSSLIVYVGTMGLLSHPVDLLLKAFKEILKTSPNTRLVLVGGGEDFKKIQSLSIELGIEKEVIFVGRVRPDEVSGYYTLADVSVDPIYNNLIAQARYPLKIIESLTVGTPVVTSDVGDRAEIIQEHGELVIAGDSSSLALGILRILKDSDLRSFYSKNALRNRNNWYWENLVVQFIKVYQCNN